MRRQLVVVSLLVTLAGCDDATVQRSLSAGPSSSGAALPLQGRVMDAATTVAVVGATVTLQGKSTTTDSAGLFVLRDLIAGPTPLTITHPQYLTLETTVTIQESSQLTDFRLTRR